MFKKKKIILILGMVLVFTLFLSLANAEDWGYNNIERDLDIQTAINYSTVYVNNSLLWDGHSWSEIYNKSDSDSRFVNIAGDTMTGNLNMGGNDISNVGNLNVLGTMYGDTSQWSRLGTDIFLTNIGDRVGIGTTTPQNKLNVIGDGNFTGNITTNSINISGGAIYFNGTDNIWDFG
jgi:hypothetical protein